MSANLDNLFEIETEPLPDDEERRRKALRPAPASKPRTKPGVRLDGVDPDLINFAAERNFTVTSGRDSAAVHETRSRHGDGGALDLRTRDKTPEEVARAIREAQARGLRAAYERKGQGRATGDHLHISKGRRAGVVHPKPQGPQFDIETAPVVDTENLFEVETEPALRPAPTAAPQSVVEEFVGRQKERVSRYRALQIGEEVPAAAVPAAASAGPQQSTTPQPATTMREGQAGGGQKASRPLPTPRGLVETGNIDLASRPVVRNADDTISTVRSMSVNMDGREVLIPTVSDDGRIMSDDEAVELYRRTGKHLGVFDSPESATAYAKALHEQQAERYGASRPLPTINLRPRVNDFNSFAETGEAQGQRPAPQTPADFVTPKTGPTIDKPIVEPNPVRRRVERAKRRAAQVRAELQGTAPAHPETTDPKPNIAADVESPTLDELGVPRDAQRLDKVPRYENGRLVGYESRAIPNIADDFTGASAASPPARRDASVPFDPARLAPMTPDQASEEYLRHFGRTSRLEGNYLEEFLKRALAEGGTGFKYADTGAPISREDFEALKAKGFEGVDVRPGVRRLAESYAEKAERDARAGLEVELRRDAERAFMTAAALGNPEGSLPPPSAEEREKFINDYVASGVDEVVKREGSARGEVERRARVAGMSWPDYVARLGVEAARGGVGVVTGAARQASVLAEAGLEGLVPMHALVRGLGNAAGYLDAKATGREFVPSGSNDAADTHLVYQLADQIEASLGDDRDLAPEFTAKVARGAGASVPLLVLGALSGGSGALAATLGAMSQGGDAYKELAGKGVKGRDRLLGSLASMPVGASEMFGLGGTINRVTSGQFLRSFARFLKDTGREATEESLQEFFQTAAGEMILNVAAERDPKAGEALGKALESMKVAAATGGLFGAGTSALHMGFGGRHAEIGSGAGPSASGGGPEAAPVPESAQTLRAQFKSAAAEDSPRVGVLLTPGESPRSTPKGFTRLNLAEGDLFVNDAKAKALGLDTPQSVREYVTQNGFEALIGKVAPVADTSQGAALRTEDAEGRELSTSIVPTPEAAEAQAQVDLAQFPEAANQQVMPAQVAARRRADETEMGGGVPPRQRGGAGDATVSGVGQFESAQQEEAHRSFGDALAGKAGGVDIGGGLTEALPLNEADSDLYARAVEVTRAAGRGSTSVLQRELRIGFGDASKLIERMEADGVVGPHRRGAARELLSSAGEQAAGNTSTAPSAGATPGSSSQAVAEAGAVNASPSAIDFSDVARPAAESAIGIGDEKKTATSENGNLQQQPSSVGIPAKDLQAGEERGDALAAQSQNVSEPQAAETVSVIRHSDPNIDGGEIVGRTRDGRLKVNNNSGSVSVVRDPRRDGNREATIQRVRRGIEIRPKAAPISEDVNVSSVSDNRGPVPSVATQQVGQAHPDGAAQTRAAGDGSALERAAPAEVATPAVEYKKIAPVTAEVSKEPFEWKTSDGQKMRAEAGDWKVTQPDGRITSVKPSIFRKTYAPVGGRAGRRAGRYMKTGTTKAQQLDRPVDIDTLEGKNHGEPGDYLVTGPEGEQYVVPRAEFEALYRPVNGANDAEAEVAANRDGQVLQAEGAGADEEDVREGAEGARREEASEPEAGQLVRRPAEGPAVSRTNGRPRGGVDTSEAGGVVSPQNVLGDAAHDEIRRAVEAADADASPTFRSFPAGMGDTNIPRSSMPQVKGEHRGAMVQYLKARGIPHRQIEVRADSLKPSQADYSPEKVKKATGFEGPDRSLITSSDAHVADGHHQWLSKIVRDPAQMIPVIEFDAPIQQLLVEMARFPSSGVDEASKSERQRPAASAESQAPGGPGVSPDSNIEPSAAEQKSVDSASVKSDDATNEGSAEERRQLREPRPPTHAVVAGKETRVRIPGTDTAYSARYAVREVEDVHPSHNPFGFQPNPDYFFVNDRHYDREKQYQQQVIERSKPSAFDPAYVVNNSPTAENGPPVIDADGNVLGGNSRAMMLHRVYRDEGEAGRAYRKALFEQAAIYGVDAGELASMRRPVLVREVEDASLLAQQAITELNAKGTTDLTPEERAVAEAGQLSPEAVEYLARQIEAGGEGATLASVLDERGVEVVNRLVSDGVFAGGERNTLLNGDKVTPEGKRRIERMLTGRIFRDLDQMERAGSALRRNVERIAAPVTRLDGTEWSITEPLRNAIDLLQEAKATGQKNLDELAAQPSMLRARDYAPEELSIAKALQGGPVQAARPFKAYANDYDLARGGGGLFGAPTKEESFEAAFGGASPLKMARAAVTETPEFKRWFEGSKVVDESGAPLVVYHGTNKDFTAFDPEAPVRHPLSDTLTDNEIGIFTTSAPEVAGAFGRGEDGNVMPLYVAIKSPLELGHHGARFAAPVDGMTALIQGIRANGGAKAWREHLIREGVDGIILRNAKAGTGDAFGLLRDFASQGTVFIPFSSVQIKSATGNRGTFDPVDPNILRMARVDEALRSVKYASDLAPHVSASREDNLVTVNAYGAEIMRRALSPDLESLDSAAAFDGIFLDPAQARAVVRTLSETAADLRSEEFGYSEEEARPLASLAREIAAAARAGKGTAVVKFEAGPPAVEPHEFFHEGSYQGAEGRALVERHAPESLAALAAHPVTIAWRRYYGHLPQYANASDALAVEEAGATVAGGDYAKLGVSEDEAVDYIERWTRSYVERNGPDAFNAFKRQEKHVREAIEKAKRLTHQAQRGPAESQATGRGGEAGRGSERPAGRGATGEVQGDAATEGSEVADTDLRPRSLPATLREQGFRAADDLYRVHTDRVAAADARALLEKHGLEGSVALLKSVERPGAEHVLLFKIVSRALQDTAAQVAEARPDDAARLIEGQRELTREVAERFTRAGEFIRAAQLLEDSVEGLGAAAERLAKKRGKPLTERERARVKQKGEDLETAAAAEGAQGSEVARLKRLSSNLRNRIRAREQRLKEMGEQVAPRRRAPREGDPAERVRQAARAIIAEDAEALRAQIKASLGMGGGPLMMARAEGDAAPQASPPPASLSERQVADLARYGSLLLLEQKPSTRPAREELVREWRGAMTREFGAAVVPHLDQIHAQAVRLRRSALAQARFDRLVSRLGAAHPDLGRLELEDLAHGELQARRLRRVAASEHNRQAGKTERLQPERVRERERRAEARQIRTLERRIEALRRKIEEGDTSRAAKRTGAPVPELETLRAEVKSLGKELARLRRTAARKPSALVDAIGSLATTEEQARNAVRLSVSGMTPGKFVEQMRVENPGMTGRQLREAFKDGARLLEAARRVVQSEKDMRGALLKEKLAQSNLERDRALVSYQNARADALRARQEVARELKVLQRGRTRTIAGEVLGAPKSIFLSVMASADVSGIGRQGLPLALMHPRSAPDLIRQTFKGYFDTPAAQNIDYVENHPDFPLLVRAGVNFSTAGGREEGEEFFRGKGYIEKLGNIPGLRRVPIVKHILKAPGELVRRSDQAYGSGLDRVRLEVGSAWIDVLRTEGKTWKDDPEDFRTIARAINIFGGRGDIGPHNAQATKALQAVLNVLSFAPRYRMSRLQMSTLPLNPGFLTAPAASRRVVYKNYLKWRGGVALALGLGALFGLVDWDDPDDSAWLKVKVGDLKIDLTSGVGLQDRFLARLAMEAWRGVSGQVTGGMAAEKMGATAGRWVKSGLRPDLSLANDWFTGEDFEGKEFHWGGWDGALASRMLPLGVSNTVATAGKHGGGYAAAHYGTEFFGFGSNVYREREDAPATRAEKLAARFAYRGSGGSSMPKDVRDRAADLKARSRRGEDVKAETGQMVEDGLITEHRARRIVDAGEQTRFQELIGDIKALADIEHVLKYATPEERKSVEEIVRQKQLNKAEREAAEKKRREAEKEFERQREELRKTEPQKAAEQESPAERRRRRAAREAAQKRRRQERRYGEQVPEGSDEGQIKGSPLRMRLEDVPESPNVEDMRARDQGGPEIDEVGAADIALTLDNLKEQEFDDFARNLDEAGQMGVLGEGTAGAVEYVAGAFGAQPRQLARSLRLLARERRLRPEQFRRDALRGRYGAALREAVDAADLSFRENQFPWSR